MNLRPLCASLSTDAHASTANIRRRQQMCFVLQETLAGLRHELDVLADTPVGALGRMLVRGGSFPATSWHFLPPPSVLMRVSVVQEGDTTIEELHAAEQRLTLELEARRERTAAQKVRFCLS